MSAKSLLKSTGIVSFFTLISRVLGLVRDVVVALFFGATMGADAFFVAFKIPNFFRRLFAEGAFAQAFVPVLTEYKTQRSHEEVRALIDRVAGDLGIILMSLTAFASLAAPWLVMVFAPGFVQFEEKLDLAAEMLRITFPYLMLISMTAFAGSALNSFGHFAAPSFAPVLLNICLITAALWVAPLLGQPVHALAWGVLFAGVLQLALQIPFMAQKKITPRPKIDWQDEGVRRILKLMVPALFGVSVSQLNLLLDTVLASFLVTGSISWLYYADRLMELPLGLFGIAIGTVILPKLSEQHANDSVQDFSNTLDWALRFILVLGAPAAIALFILAEPIITTLFQYKAFTLMDVNMTALSLRAYSIGILAFMLIKVLAPGYFARQDIKTPVKIGVKAMVLNMLLNLLFIWQFKHMGLAMATSLSALFNAGLLYWGLRQSDVYRPAPGWWQFGLQIVAACTAMSLILIVLSPSLREMSGYGLWFRIAVLTQYIVAGAATYFAILWLAGMRPRDFMRGERTTSSKM